MNKDSVLQQDVAASPRVKPVRVSAPSGSGFRSLDAFRGGVTRRFYSIDDIDDLPPFLMTVVGDTDLWMYISTSGALTAGRVEPERCIFPYVTDDHLHANAGLIGPVTRIRTTTPEGAEVLWKPLDPNEVLDPRDPERPRRSLYRTLAGDAVILEEDHPKLGMTFSYEWSLSDRLGIVRQCTLRRHAGRGRVYAEVLDGMVDLMPAGVPLFTQQTSSTLVDAFKRAELDPHTHLAIFALESRISDRAAPAESLRANVVWRTGLVDAEVSLTEDSIRAFETRRSLDVRPLQTGRRGAYLCRAVLQLDDGGSESWAFVADAGLDQPEIVKRNAQLSAGELSIGAIQEDLVESSDRLARLLDDADACEMTSDERTLAAHRSNVLFNAMRGGIPINGYEVDRDHFISMLGVRNTGVAAKHGERLAALPERVRLDELRSFAAKSDDADLERLTLEYLPLTFGRRHGDPSRPWNRFSIRVRNDDGARAVGYQGNWRDIFQNWEALCLSYPELLPGIVAKFVNASTVDGFNPYRISESGIDWEVPEPDNPWANIGYWGDHQIVYLCRLLEQLVQTRPDVLADMFGRRIYSYADVPYVIAGFDDIVADPKSTISFDHAREARIGADLGRLGTDAKLVRDPDGGVMHVSLVEKLLVMTLAKASNIVPPGRTADGQRCGGGVWLNTQRPEWNDANNAIVGHGLSMVTLYQLRKFADGCAALMSTLPEGGLGVSASVAQWATEVGEILARSSGRTDGFDDGERWTLVRDLGQSFAAYRSRVASEGLGEAAPYTMNDAVVLMRAVRDCCDLAIRHAKGDDGLYQSYNLIKLGSETAGLEPLYNMLEGQVAVLSSGALNGAEAADLIDALFKSDIYRDDQRTFMLYPVQPRLAFLDRNVVPDGDGCELMDALLDAGDISIVERDAGGRVRFSSDFGAATDLEAALDEIGADPVWTARVAAGREALLDVFERVFNHRAFTGRSGTMHKYEGIGSVYWHMVSKCLLAVGECVYDAIDAGMPRKVVDRLAASYDRVRDGLGPYKTAREFGAIPHEPYSHTPAHLGAQQPGMTGQVKEGMLARRLELGIRLIDGRLRFDPALLHKRELLDQPASMTLHRPDGTTESVALDAGSLASTCCAVPLVYTLDDTASLRVTMSDGTRLVVDSNELPEKLTREILTRSGLVERIDVRVPRDRVRS